MNILITSIGRRSYMIDYFKNNLTKEDKVYAVNNVLTFALKQADYYAVCPSIYDENYIPYLLNYCVENRINALISLFDIDLPILAKNKSRFEEIGVQLIISDEDFVNICNDKWLTFLFLKTHQFDVPRTYLNKSSFLDDYNLSKISFPIVIKPRFGMGSIGIEIANDIEELNFYYKKISKTINSTYLKYESSIDIENCILIQEKLQGQEYGLDIHNSLKKEYLVTIPKKKIAMRAGETDIAEVIKDSNLIEIGKKLSSITLHKGNLDVDVFKVENKYYILEMNARFGGQYPFSHLSGVNLIKVLIDQIKGEKISFEDIEFKEIKACKDVSVVLI